MSDEALIEAMARDMCQDYWGDLMEWRAFIPSATAALAALRKTHAVVPAIARRIEEYHEDMGNVLWWRFPIDEPPYVGMPGDSDWISYHTHFTPIPTPMLNASEATDA